MNPPRPLNRDRLEGLRDYLKSGGQEVPIQAKELHSLVHEVIVRRDAAQKRGYTNLRINAYRIKPRKP